MPHSSSFMGTGCEHSFVFPRDAARSENATRPRTPPPTNPSPLHCSPWEVVMSLCLWLFHPLPSPLLWCSPSFQPSRRGQTCRSRLFHPACRDRITEWLHLHYSPTSHPLHPTPPYPLPSFLLRWPSPHPHLPQFQQPSLPTQASRPRPPELGGSTLNS